MTTARLFLTINQARELQRETAHNEEVEDWVWPGKWMDAYSLVPSKEPNSRPDKKRIETAVTMLSWGCSREQVADQMNWRHDADPLDVAVARYERSKSVVSVMEAEAEIVASQDTIKEPCPHDRSPLEWRSPETRWLKGSKRH